VAQDKCVTGALLRSSRHADKILAITFTNKATREISERLKRGLCQSSSPANVHTFHSWCLRLLRNRTISRLAGFSFSLNIWDTPQQVANMSHALMRAKVNHSLLPLARRHLGLDPTGFPDFDAGWQQLLKAAMQDDKWRLILFEARRVALERLVDTVDDIRKQRNASKHGRTPDDDDDALPAQAPCVAATGGEGVDGPWAADGGTASDVLSAGEVQAGGTDQGEEDGVVDARRTRKQMKLTRDRQAALPAEGWAGVPHSPLARLAAPLLRFLSNWLLLPARGISFGFLCVA
jgi:hypothetical protein